MSDTKEKIVLTREQWDAFYRERNYTAQCHPSFDSLKAHVEKPKRREWHNVKFIKEGFSVESSFEGLGIHVKEVLRNDVGPMTREEARKWVIGAAEELGWVVLTETEKMDEFLKALGLGEE